MLGRLFGNRNVERVLLFLFVNGRCYASQVSRRLQVALTPIQKALDRLEKGEVVFSHYEGKTRLYQFNPGYPLVSDLESLLKSAYTHLPAGEKRLYMIPDALPSSLANPLALVEEVWEQLQKVRTLSFQAKSNLRTEGGWGGKGQGEVNATFDPEYRLCFEEEGAWRNARGEEFAFRNSYRWTLDRASSLLSLEHLRRGIEHPVFLFHLAPIEGKRLASVDSHLCGGDLYHGQLHLKQGCLRLHWRAIGPRKDEEMTIYYNN